MERRDYQARTKLVPTFMSCTQQIHKQPRGSGNSCWQFPEESIASVDVSAFSGLRTQQAAFERLFSGIMRGKQRFEMIVPLIAKVESALLHPARKISLRNLIGKMKDTIFWSEDLHRRFLDRDPRPSQLKREGSEVSAVEVAHAGVVLHN